jgi:hypothetical protein
MSEPSTILRFDVFELDTAAGELRRHGDRIKLRRNRSLFSGCRPAAAEKS